MSTPIIKTTVLKVRSNFTLDSSNLYKTVYKVPEKKTISLNKKSLNHKLFEESNKYNKVLPNVIKHNLFVHKAKNESVESKNSKLLESSFPHFNQNKPIKYKSSKRNNSITLNKEENATHTTQFNRFILKPEPKSNINNNHILKLNHNGVNKTRNKDENLKDCFSLSPKSNNKIFENDNKINLNLSNNFTGRHSNKNQLIKSLKGTKMEFLHR